MEDLLDAPEIKKIKVNYTRPIIWGSLLFLGILLRMIHGAFGNELIICSSAGITAFAWSNMVMVTKLTNIPFVTIGVAGLIWLLVFLWGAFLNGGYPYNDWGLLLYVVFFIIVCAINYVRHKVPNETE